MTTTTLDTPTVNAVASLAQQAQDGESRIVEVEGQTYSATLLHAVIPPQPPKDPEPAALVVHTLTGLLDYIEANRDELPLSECVLHVVEPGRVDLRSKLQGHHLQRLTYIRAETFDRFAAFPAFTFGRFMETESMVIAVRALFADAHDRAALLKFVGGVKSIADTEQTDDGYGQVVNLRAGVVRTAQAEAPLNLTLSPFRTFAEVDQPASEFFLRLRPGVGDAGATAALFEADGGAWRLAAVAAVDAFLSARLHEAGINSADETTLAVIA